MPRIKLAEAAQHFADAARALNTRLAEAEAVTLRQAAAEAVKLSSGTLTTADLRQRGHPYAVRNPTSANPEVINAQSGVFRQSFVSVPPALSGGTIQASLVNTSKPAGYLANGTRFMIARPLAVAVQAAVQPARLKRVKAAVTAAFIAP